MMNSYEKENIGRLRPYLAECTVLLKKNGAFPLDGPCRIAACGSGVRDTIKGGTGSGEVNSRYFVNIEQGLKDAGFTITNPFWPDMYKAFNDKARREFVAGVRKKARREKINVIAASMGAVMKQPEYVIPLDYSADAAIYVVSRISGEGNDRLAEKGDFMLTDSEVRDILALDKHYEKFMLVVNAGGPVDLNPVMEVGNILVLSQLGVETGAALADILLGKAYPSGKLATTWAAVEDQCTAGDFGGRDDTRYREGIYVGYRFFESFGLEVLFPFGYGLGYTDFSAGKAAVKVNGPEVKVSARITNKGQYKGKETLQVYVSCPQGRLDRESKSLAGFAKTGELAPKKSETVSVSFDIRDLAGFDTKSASYVLEKGDYIVLAGTDSVSAKPAAVLRLNEDFTALKAERLFDGADFNDLRGFDSRDFNTAKLPVYDLDLTGCVTEGLREKNSLEMAALVPDGLTAEELAVLNVGDFKDKGLSIASIIGEASQGVAGAAGESCRRYMQKGIDSIVMADGPAGVRISKRYYEDKKGKHSVGSTLPETMLDMLPGLLRKLLDSEPKEKKGRVFREQYCTAIPIATAIAQTWNTDFAELCGDIVGSEMDIFGIDLWLAPALNIHRSVLCGRNFEYFSEDPLVSGKFAAALTRGVQKHPGRGVTIKHYAANNQETNRYANNSIISERALREIYLKGFGICIREADPMAVMTSYNLLNGEHTSESRELAEVLFREFGFDGLIMTDWVVGGDMLLAKGSKYGTPDAAKVAASGCSLFMPGNKKDYAQIIMGLKKGTVSVQQLRENAGRIMHVLNRLGKEA
ncbi:MAG: glycoside hydrolase family 3 C-terminal domain-containing protein [Mogibacterium sp.]|nr:glycoside hydrolase family 3 C-terminal domain-containing protein [Mogibacterium sp.]